MPCLSCRHVLPPQRGLMLDKDKVLKVTMCSQMIPLDAHAFPVSQCYVILYLHLHPFYRVCKIITCIQMTPSALYGNAARSFLVLPTLLSCISQPHQECLVHACATCNSPLLSNLYLDVYIYKFSVWPACVYCMYYLHVQQKNMPFPWCLCSI